LTEDEKAFIIPVNLSWGKGWVKVLVRWFRSLKSYFIEAWGELRKVTWPSRKELWNSTITVLVVIILVGIFLGVVDLLLTFIMGLYLR